MTKRILTGDRPTGRLHLGHYVGTLSNRVALQSKYEMYISVVDLHSLTDRMDDPQKVKNIPDSVRELVLDYLAVGINPEKTTILLQSAIPEISELFAILMNLVTIARCERLPALKEKIRDQKIQHPSMGLLNYPILMASDILSLRAHLVPVGKDQESHIEFAREIAKTFNRLYKSRPGRDKVNDDEDAKKVFPEPEAIIGEAQTLPGTDGKAKMSKSLNNAIFLSDDERAVEEKVMSMYTDPKRTSASVPGTIEGNPLFIYHEIFNKNISEVEKFAERYRTGDVGDVEVKKALVKALNTFLNPIRFRRKNFEEQKGLIDKVLTEGTKKARVEIQNTLQIVKQSLGLPILSS
ncbi:MAG: Tryptophan-tRNA ligase [Microgenomates group bacterium GW2011_GWC1_41_8]|uniref:Tryptophan--tRNA ligase n=3 Tax=Candidatus Roizmaniibacteriota TaxID=1752723 RepID=A0A0G0X9Q1_9BACT|nr:MAG: Tryptophan-tRNA ligase [Candidatus Roizmanbacteria bacterium GW2011_GWB1_40_7]KKR94144.1 MAG: Tryptophan-tRNA ligase [Candidatus Roizmanbacteria bacterium GW2011_GWA1_41_13]KKS21719.1 MAG: Tryptophan-tRNA ligase [Candidatus Roizmanbacteria bacterium GW2011_GWC2_41_7]KKS23707.1 MAG: Tryptophan-tRNA ligase [Microgenomates group bacterium GW2011_GWC1_41_8]OGK50333.1 MAG: tryptophan--tRNA ligase [Candidatus Roizmanbacteria bacterium RIFCSPLOWO2_01_FULL_40_14]